jgi:ketosteroid isomerase-like protein
MNNVAQINREIENWLREWENCIRKADYKAARKLFDPNVFSFGTYTFVANGLTALEEQQWRHIWSLTSGFHFDIPSVQLRLSDDHSMAIVMASWSSTGYYENKLPFIRNGRASIVLTYKQDDCLWRTIHTHFSLDPCTADPRSAAQTDSIKEQNQETLISEVAKSWSE